MPRISRRPSIKMRRLAQELIKTGSGTEAAINAGYQVQARHNAAVLTSEYLSKPDFKSMVLAELEKAEATKGAAITVIARRMNDTDPKNAGVSLKAAIEVMKLWQTCEMETESEPDGEHQILREPLEVRRWFLLSGRMPTEDERKLLTGLKNGDSVNPDLLAKMLSGKK